MGPDNSAEMKGGFKVDKFGGAIVRNYFVVDALIRVRRSNARCRHQTKRDIWCGFDLIAL